MALVEKVKADDFSLGSALTVSGRIFLCTPRDLNEKQCIAKKLGHKAHVHGDYQREGDRFKSAFVHSLYIVLPDRIWEDKAEKCTYVIMPRMVKSVLEILQESRRKGKLLPMSLVKRIVSDVMQALKKVHSKKLFHGHIKPGNILLNEEEEFNLGDFGLFSQDPE
jgi:serine/threonine protein kinase